MKRITKHLTPGNLAIFFSGGLAGGLISLAGVDNGAIAAVFTWLILYVLQSRYMKSLDARMAADLSISWTVWLNGVSIGEIPDAEFAKIRHRVMTSSIPYIQQATNLVTTLVRAWFQVSAYTLVFAFWMVLACTLADPTVPRQLIDVLQNPEGAKQMVATTAIVIVVCYMGIFFLFGGTLEMFGWSNQFRRETGRYLRYFFKSPVADAEYVIGRYTETGAFVVNDEMDYVSKMRPKSPPSTVNVD